MKEVWVRAVRDSAGLLGLRPWWRPLVAALLWGGAFVVLWQLGFAENALGELAWLAALITSTVAVGTMVFIGALVTAPFRIQRDRITALESALARERVRVKELEAGPGITATLTSEHRGRNTVWGLAVENRGQTPALFVAQLRTHKTDLNPLDGWWKHAAGRTAKILPGHSDFLELAVSYIQAGPAHAAHADLVHAANGERAVVRYLDWIEAYMQFEDGTERMVEVPQRDLEIRINSDPPLEEPWTGVVPFTPFGPAEDD